VTDENDYLQALRDHLAGGGEATLQRAYEIGRRALASGVELLTLARTHHAALDTLLLPAGSPQESARTLAGAAAFFAECISPYEMAYRGYHEANTALRHLNKLLESEAGRIGQSLHDETGQLLVAVHIALADLVGEVPQAARIQVEKAIELLDQVEEQLRQLSHELRPAILDDLGLIPALEYLSLGFSQRARIAVAIDGSPQVRFAPAIESALYRVAQESLNNIARHARAQHARIRIGRENGAIRCTISDDGIGFDVRATLARGGRHCMGLTGMRERVAVLGGTLEIKSAAGQGTELVISIPAAG